MFNVNKMYFVDYMSKTRHVATYTTNGWYTCYTLAFFDSIFEDQLLDVYVRVTIPCEPFLKIVKSIVSLF